MNQTNFFSSFETALGRMTAVMDQDGCVTELWTRDRREELVTKPGYIEDPSAVREVFRQVCEYAEGNRREFELELRPAGTPFQQLVWSCLLKIPYGETRSYGELAVMAGNPKGSRAVGSANGSNPISIIIPCHRVIGANGSLTGYGGGLAMKQKLLALEGTWAGQLNLL